MNYLYYLKYYVENNLNRLANTDDLRKSFDGLLKYLYQLENKVDKIKSGSVTSSSISTIINNSENINQFMLMGC